ncbi:MAG: glycosyltransferase [Candidatus Acidiferrales bacterium]
MRTLISVIVCSRNRAQTLPLVLESLFTSANVGSSDWEMLVVDNDSTDGTAALCRSYQNRFPRHFRFLAEPKHGKSNALNRAVTSARGDILAFTDDDAVCAPDYLQAIRNVFSEDGIDAAQGRVLLECEGGRPDWMDDLISLSLGLRDHGDEVTNLAGTLDGVNMMVRAEVFQRIGGFCAELGPGAVGLWEDTEISLRMRKNGFRLVYAPQVLVHHHLPRNRVTMAELRKRSFQNGRAVAYYEELPVSLPRFALYLAKEWVIKETAALWNLLKKRPTQALHCQCFVYGLAGIFWQHWLFYRGVPRRLTFELPLEEKEKTDHARPSESMVR